MKLINVQVKTHVELPSGGWLRGPAFRVCERDSDLDNLGVVDVLHYPLVMGQFLKTFTFYPVGAFVDETWELCVEADYVVLTSV